MKRYLCQFRDVDKDYFVTDCGFDELGPARRYVNRVVANLDSVAEGQVYDALSDLVKWHVPGGQTDYIPGRMTER